MSKIRYDWKTFSRDGEQVVRAADAICQEYMRAGLPLTLRGLYYRFIATDAFPDTRWFYKTPGGSYVRDKHHEHEESTKNCDQNYKWLGSLVADGRVAGLIDWNAIEDTGRVTAGGDSGWPSPESAMRSIENAYSITHWDGQPKHIEAWVEKDALNAVVARACRPWNVSNTACKGSPSHSLVHDAALRLRGYEADGVTTRILYLGDHDPTGLDIPRDIQDRLRLFGSKCEVERIALNMDQIEQYDPPPNYAKESDSRFQAYVDLYGPDCWELDALEPQVIIDLIDGHIREHVDEEMYREREAQEERERQVLSAIRERWDDVRDHLVENGWLDDDSE